MSEHKKDAPKRVMEPVKSSMLHGTSYDAATKTLFVQYAENGPVFRHVGVTQELVDGMKKADSVGKYFAAEIRSKFKGIKE